MLQDRVPFKHQNTPRGQPRANHPRFRVSHGVRKPTSDGKKSKTDHRLLGSLGISMSELPGKCSINLLMQLVNTRLRLGRGARRLSSFRRGPDLFFFLGGVLVSVERGSQKESTTCFEGSPKKKTPPILDHFP